ncbi:hypothetical protein [Myxococcus sp. RHSTA-1-4]|uniref:hypothetical protein n=1 Tax=Myxococcus sp. RHSTA-1-4 TaxID=2874601 RepID=UPI001CBC9962|nr:hypothetical protein [Myxococcus sp. RHSTA-1-4]MBZ4421605.1 hypothetical protein [Myxococcus sp. RHSTA-1-4]
MKFQCEACERLVPLEVFRVEAGVLVVKCDRCGAESRARAPAASSAVMGGAAASPPAREGTGPGAPPSEPEAAPPPPARPSSPALRVVRTQAGRPGAPLSDEELFEAPAGDCPKCVAPRREGAESCAQCGLVYVNFSADEHRPSSVLADAWRALSEHWEDEEAHDRLMTLAMARGELAMAGRLYRLRLARVPEDAMARRGRDEVVRRATLAVPGPGELSGPSPTQKRMKTVLAAVMFLVVVVLAVLVFQNLRALMSGP